MKILIVDDEAFIRQALVSRLGKCPYSFDEILQASDGQDGLELFTQYQPEIIITDIKMDQVSGLEMIEKCLSFNHSAKFIILSGYADFSYAQQALRLGAAGYLLKPVTQSALNEVLEKAISELSEKKNMDQIKMEKMTMYLNSLIQKASEKALEPGEYDSLLQFLNASANDDFQVINMHLTAYSKEHFSSLEDAYHIIETQMARYATVPFQFFPERNKQNRYCIFYQHALSDDLIMPFLRQFMHRCSLYDIILTIGVSCPSSLLTFEQFKQAQQALSNRFFRGNGSIYQASALQKEMISADTWDIKTLENELKYCGNSEILYQKLVAILMQNASLIYNFDYFVQATFILLVRLNFKLDTSRWEYFKQQRPWTDCESREEALSLLKKELLNVCLDNENILSAPSYVELAIAYMENHYHEDLSLESLANSLHLNSRYFSTLFKRAKGITPIDYLTDIRIGKAMQLLKSGELSAAKISLLVGYKDPSYFYKVFKKRTGLTPSDYCKQNGTDSKT